MKVSSIQKMRRFGKRCTGFVELRGEEKRTNPSTDGINTEEIFGGRRILLNVSKDLGK